MTDDELRQALIAIRGVPIKLRYGRRMIGMATVAAKARVSPTTVYRCAEPAAYAQYPKIRGTTARIKKRIKQALKALAGV